MVGANVREQLQWLVRQVEEEIYRIYLQLIPAAELPVAARSPRSIFALAPKIVVALGDAGIGDGVIQSFKEGVEDCRVGDEWAQQAISASDRQRPLASWSIGRLGRGHRRLMQVSQFVAIRQAALSHSTNLRTKDASRHARFDLVPWHGARPEGSAPEITLQ